MSELCKMIKALDRAYEVLKEIEWEGEPAEGYDSPNDSTCPYCFHISEFGHKTDCKLKGVLKDIEECLPSMTNSKANKPSAN